MVDLGQKGESNFTFFLYSPYRWADWSWDFRKVTGQALG